MEEKSVERQFSELVRLARTRTRYYRGLYADLPDEPTRMRMPVVDQEKFWASHAEDRQNVLTERLFGGIVLASGGTTGQPKFSYFTRAEYDAGIEMSATAFASTGIIPGERIANLFPAGDLYGAFLTATHSLQRVGVETLQFPIGFLSADDFVCSTIERFAIDAIAGMPSRLLRLFSFVREKGIRLPIRQILFAGEPFYKDQMASIEELFPGAEARSLGYGSVDGGILGYSDGSCGPGEHRVFGKQVILELVDENGVIIDRPGEPGAVIVTNLTRRLMPIIRYPSGDRAEWLEEGGSADRKFRLLGRAKEGARLADVNVFVQDVRRIAAETAGTAFPSIQFTIDRPEGRDRLKIFLAHDEGGRLETEGASHRIRHALFREQPVLEKMVESQLIAPIEVSVGRIAELYSNPRTGKTPAVVDLRMA